MATVVTTTAMALVFGCSQTADPEGAATADEGAAATTSQALAKASMDIPLNGLPTLALTQNYFSTNVTNSRDFVASPLASDTFDPAKAMHHELVVAAGEAQSNDFLRYVVTCALTPDMRVTAGGVDMPGQLGLCPEWGLPGGKADVGCQERVSACLLAFNNPNGVSVPLSIRGAVNTKRDLAVLAPAKTPVKLQVKETSPFLPAPQIASFAPCTSPASGVGAACGWNPGESLTGYVGTCAPGGLIAVGTGAACGNAAPLGSSSGDTVLRVCRGLRGCDPGSPAELASNDDACGGLASYATFTCPDVGVFNVMVAAYSRGAAVTATVAAMGLRSAQAVTYPAPEAEIFGVREGAFYGNIFRTDALAVSWAYSGQVWTPTVLQPTDPQMPTPYLDMFSCSDENWGQDSTAHITNRTCATTGEYRCAARLQGTCQSRCFTPVNKLGPMAGAAFGQCTSRTSLTTFLNTKCDVGGGPCVTLPIIGVHFP